MRYVDREQARACDDLYELVNRLYEPTTRWPEAHLPFRRTFYASARSAGHFVASGFYREHIGKK